MLELELQKLVGGNMSKRINIKKRLMIRYVSLIIIFGMVCLSGGVSLAKKILIQNSAVLLSNFAKETGKNISHIIELEMQNVEMIADTPLLHNLEGTEEEKMTYLRKMAQKYDYKKAAIIDLEGNCKMINDELVNVADLEYFQKGLEGKSFLSAPYLNESDGTLQIAITAPIISGEQIIGILLFSKDAESFSGITNGLGFGETGTAYVVDEDGTNIINGDINKVLQKTNRIEDAKTNPDFKELGAITERMIAGENGTGSYMLDGKRKFLGYAPIAAKGWAVGVTVELKDMLSGLKELKICIGVSTVIIIIWMLIVTFRISEDYSKRLMSVQDELSQVAKGDFTLNKKHYEIMDEISEIDHTLQLAKASLSEMVEKMQLSYEKRKGLSEYELNTYKNTTKNRDKQ